LTGKSSPAAAGPRRRGKKRPRRAQTARGPAARPLVEQLETRLVLTAGQWTQLANDAPDGIGTMLLLTDGSVMAQGPNRTNNWYKLTPGADESYVNGTWSSLADMSVPRLFFASNVLHDGRVFVMGGEYSSNDQTPDDVNTGEVYEPSSNLWLPVANFPQIHFGDDPSILLDNGQILCGYINIDPNTHTSPTYLYNPAMNAWTQTGAKLTRVQNGQLITDQSDEETWLKLPDGSVLSYDIFASIGTGTFHAERYVPASNQWVDASNVDANHAPQLLSSGSLGDEMGGATLLPDGRAWFVGVNGHTAFYTPSTDTWAAGPDLPGGQMADDAPLCMMPNGHVLLAADGPGTALKGTHTHIYDFDPSFLSTNINPFTQVDVPGLDLSGVPAFTCRMLALPSGQVLFTANYADDNLYVYTPFGLPNDAWRPTITGISMRSGFSLAPEFELTGTQLNGISAGASYGDDAEMDSNYPIVSYTDSAGHVRYAQGFDRSSNGVMTGSALVSTSYFLPPGITHGAFLVRAIANGIASKPVLNVIMDQSLNNITLEIDPTNSGFYDVFSGSTLLSQWDTFSFSGVDVTMLSAGTVNILHSLPSAPVHVYGAGQATVNIGNGDMNHLRGISGAIDVENTTGFNTITINDSLAPERTLHSHTVNLVSVNLRTILNGSPGLSGQLAEDTFDGLIDVPITWKYADTSRVTILGPPVDGVTWNVLGSGAATQIVAKGADTFNIGNAGSVQGILGELDIEDPPSLSTINIDDSADNHARAVTMSTLASNPIDFGGDQTDDWGQIIGLAPGNIRFEYGDTSSITVKTSSALGNVINVQGTEVTTNLVTAGFNTVNVGNAGNLADIDATLNIENPSNRNNLTIDDSADPTARTATLSNVGPNPNDSDHDSNDWGQVSGLSPGVINYEYADTADITLGVGNAATVNVQAAENNGTLTLKAVGPTAVNVGSAGSTQGVTAFLTLSGPAGAFTLTVDDSADPTARTVTATNSALTGMTRFPINFAAGQGAAITLVPGAGGIPALTFSDQSTALKTYTLTATAVQRTGGFSVTYSNVQSLTVNGGGGTNTWVVSGTPTAAAVALIGGGNDTFKFTGAGSLPGTINGGGGTANRLDYSALFGSISVNLQTGAAPRVNGGAAGGFRNIQVFAGSSPFLGVNPVNTLIGPTGDTTWGISSPGAGLGLTGRFKFAFSGFQKLVGGPGVDVFKFAGTGSVPVSLDGGGAPVNQGNWLDYSGLTVPIAVNLQTGAASGVAGGAPGRVANIQNVHGGNAGNLLTGNAQGNILIGGPGPDTIAGGSGASLLIGDRGADRVTGGSGGDILIGNTISLDAMTAANETALMGILAEWQSADDYATRFTDINTGTGGGLNGTAKLNAGTTIQDDAAADTVTATASDQALDWFFQGAGDTLVNVEPGEHINNNTAAAFKDRTVTSLVGEGGLATVSGTITDPDGRNPFTLVVDWGDGTPAQTYTFPAGSDGRRVSVSHRYRDNGTYSIALSWHDPLGPANQATLAVTVANIAPAVHVGADTTAKEGVLFQRQGWFADPGADTWTATVDYGDGSGPQPLALDGHHFVLEHQYEAKGTYHVVVTVRDDDGDVGTASFTLTVL
jgi:hypothetical protein